MGMSDYLRSDYPLGDDFSGVCQTKDIDDFGGGTLTQYWISPSGHLYRVDYSNTQECQVVHPDDDDWDPKKFFCVRWLPTGQRGRVVAEYLTKYIVIYPETWDKGIDTWPEVRLHFVEGVLQDFKVLKPKGA